MKEKKDEKKLGGSHDTEDELEENVFVTSIGGRVSKDGKTASFPCGTDNWP